MTKLSLVSFLLCSDCSRQVFSFLLSSLYILSSHSPFTISHHKFICIVHSTHKFLIVIPTIKTFLLHSRSQWQSWRNSIATLLCSNFLVHWVRSSTKIVKVSGSPRGCNSWQECLGLRWWWRTSAGFYQWCKGQDLVICFYVVYVCFYY